MLVKNDDDTKMEEGEYFAIETFGSTGRGKVVEQGEVSHYARKVDAPHVPLRYCLFTKLWSHITTHSFLYCRYMQVDDGQVFAQVNQQKLWHSAVL